MKTATATQQRGAALIVSLMFLLVLTIIGIASVSTTKLQERMAHNTREQNLALQAAEAALRDGEAWLFSLKGSGEPPLPINTCSTSNCGNEVAVWGVNSSQISSVADRTHTWWLANGREHGVNPVPPYTDTRQISTQLHAQQPRYIVQKLATTGAAAGSLGVGLGPKEDLGQFIYRIYGYGVGRVEYTDNGELRHFDALVESIFRVSQF